MPKRAAEGSESKELGTDLLTNAMEHCWGDGFLDTFREYFRKHAHKFETIAEGKTEEHSLEYQELFNEYLLMFEGKLEEFIASILRVPFNSSKFEELVVADTCSGLGSASRESQGSTAGEFYTAIRDNQDNADPKVQLFIKCLLASADYDSFFSVMRKEAQKSLRRKRLERDESKVCDAEGKDERRSDSCEGKAVEGRCRSKEDERAYK